MRENQEIEKIKVNELNPHEAVIEENLLKVLNSLKTDKRLKKPLIVDRDTKIILDGHHRAEAFKVLGLRKIPCLLVDYSSVRIEVRPHRNGNVSKEEVIEKGLSDKVFHPKTSKHEMDLDCEKFVDQSIADLKR